MAAGVVALAFILVLPWPLRLQLRGEVKPGSALRVTARVAVWRKWFWTATLPAPLTRGGRRRAGRRAVPWERFLARRLSLPGGAWDRARLLVPALARGLRYLAAHLRVVRLVWHTRVGLPDAELCALAATAIQMGQTAAGLAASRARPLSPLDIRAYPDYRRLGLDTFLDCTVRVPPARILAAGLLVLAPLRGCSQDRPSPEPRGRSAMD